MPKWQYTSGGVVWTWPTGETEALVLMWGGGASGGTSTDGEGGGGGGAFASAYVTKTVATASVTVGAGGTNGNGADSTFIQSGVTNVRAKGGSVGSGRTGGLGGSAGASVGDVVFAGGDGGTSTGADAGGGSGGSSAGKLFNGVSGAANIGSSSGGATTGPLSSGDGGGGGNNTSSGSAGTVPGGGGGGGGANGGSRGAGANGKIIILCPPPIAGAKVCCCPCSLEKLILPKIVYVAFEMAAVDTGIGYSWDGTALPETCAQHEGIDPPTFVNTGTHFYHDPLAGVRAESPIELVLVDPVAAQDIISNWPDDGTVPAQHPGVDLTPIPKPSERCCSVVYTLDTEALWLPTVVTAFTDTRAVGDARDPYPFLKNVDTLDVEWSRHFTAVNEPPGTCNVGGECVEHEKWDSESPVHGVISAVLKLLLCPDGTWNAQFRIKGWRIRDVTYGHIGPDPSKFYIDFDLLDITWNKTGTIGTDDWDINKLKGIIFDSNAINPASSTCVNGMTDIAYCEQEFNGWGGEAHLIQYEPITCVIAICDPLTTVFCNPASFEVGKRTYYAAQVGDAWIEDVG